MTAPTKRPPTAAELIAYARQPRLPLEEVNVQALEQGKLLAVLQGSIDRLARAVAVVAALPSRQPSEVWAHHGRALRRVVPSLLHAHSQVHQLSAPNLVAQVDATFYARLEEAIRDELERYELGERDGEEPYPPLEERM